MSFFPTPTAALPMAPTWPVVAPLTTPWSFPAACQTPLPRFSQGTCRSNTCTPDTFHDTGLGTGFINYPYQTALGSLTETQCQPSGWNAQDDYQIFIFRPATGCPAGYSTAASTTYGSLTDLAILSCCPPGYTLSTSVITDTRNGDTFNLAGCTSQWTMTSGQRYLGVAEGFNTESMLSNSSGTIIPTTTRYWTQSVISTGYLTVTTTVAQVVQPLLLVAVPTQSVAGWTPPTGTSTAPYTIFGLPFVYSILATVGMGVGGLALLCISCCCVRSCSSSRRPPPPPPLPLTGTYPGLGTIPTTTTSTYVANCRHSRSSLCSYRLSYESTCCACKDSRPASPSLTVQSRTITYCPPCRQYWRSQLSSQIPVEWRPAANVDDLIDQIIEERKCVHGIVGAACSRCPPGSKKCCACVDPRVGQLLSQETRAASYCETCRDFFRDCTPAECPAEWRLADLQCEHSRSKACSQAKQYEMTCCACKDTRRGAMPRHDRTATYCVSCSSYFNALAVSLLPQSWGIKCDHGDLYTRCSTHSRTGQCCACLDNRSGPPGFNKQVRTSTYCSPCSTHWKNTDDSLCPRFWNLKCPHGRANAWEKGMRYTSGPCCCACKDTNKSLVPKATRLRGYCANCRSLWNATPDNECPPEWQLGCRHNGMATRCLNGGPTRTKCCACNDRRTKNLAKASRVRNYCATCESAWKATPDSQCPPEWRLMEPRNDCKHAMALECGNAPEGDAKCCACRDGRKFIGLTARLASYCQQCRSVWQQASSKTPAGWSVSEKDIPVRYFREGCLPRRPITTYKRESQEKYCRQFDEGPRYGAPRYGRKEEPVAAPRPLASNNPFQRHSQAMSKQSPSMVAISQYTTQATISPPQSPRKPNYQGYQEKGPQHSGPRFTVAPDTALPQPTPISPQKPVDEKRRSVFTDPPKKKPSTMSDEEKRRRKEQAGLCVGRQPKFLVPPIRDSDPRDSLSLLRD